MWDLFPRHRLIGHGWGRDRRRSLAPHSSNTLITDNRNLTGGIRRLISFTRHHEEEDGVAPIARNGVEKVGEQKWELMGLGVHGSVQLCMYSRCHSVTIHFPRKRFIFVSTTHMIRPWDWEAKKAGSLKYFETRPREGVLVNIWVRFSLYQIIRHGHSPEQEKKIM
jgi:hypothetical protein